MTPKIPIILSTDKDGNQKYVELTQQQALAYNAGALPILQNAIGAGGGQQYILTDQGGQFKATAFDRSSQQLIAAENQPGTTASLGGEAVKMVHYVDIAGHKLSQDQVQYYALDGDYSVKHDRMTLFGRKVFGFIIFRQKNIISVTSILNLLH